MGKGSKIDNTLMFLYNKHIQIGEAQAFKATQNKMKQKYFYQTEGRKERSFFGKKGDKKATLTKAMDVKINRHVKIKGLANLYDPEFEIYFECRLNKQAAENLKDQGKMFPLWKKQNGKCPVCQQRIDDETKWHQHHITWKVYGGKDTLDNLVMLMLLPNCHRQLSGS